MYIIEAAKLRKASSLSRMRGHKPMVIDSSRNISAMTNSLSCKDSYFVSGTAYYEILRNGGLFFCLVSREDFGCI